MIECDAIQARMPDVVHARASWTEAERTHLVGCESCAKEWRLVQSAAALFRDTVVDIEAIARRLRSRAAAPLPTPSLQRTPRRGARLALGILAAAASVLLLVKVLPNGVPAVRPSTPATAVAVLPELDGLTETQLEKVLSELTVVEETVTPMRLPRLGDLSEAQLEQVLRDLEG